MQNASVIDDTAVVTPVLTVYREPGTTTVTKPKRIRNRNPVIDLPRGLWVGRVPRKDAPKRDEEVLKALRKSGQRPWEVWPEHYYPDYVYRITKFVAGKAVVDKDSLETRDYKTAVKRALVEYNLRKEAKYNARAKALLDEEEEVAVAVPTFGEVVAAFQAIYGEDKLRRVVGDARLVFAQATGLVQIDPNPHGRKFAIQKDGPEIAEVAKVPVTRWNSQLVREYYTRKQGGKYDPVTPHEDHRAYNKTVQHAKQLFAPEVIKLCFSGLNLPDMTDFREAPELKEVEIDPGIKEVPAALFADMHAKAQRLRLSDDVKERELGFANWLFRTLALRTCELLNAKQDWIVTDEDDGRDYLHIRNRPNQPYVGKSERGGATYTVKGKEAGAIPLTPEQAAFLRAKDCRGAVDSKGKKGPDGYLFYPTGSRSARVDLLKTGHNAFVKPIIGREGCNQGNHLLRAYVATYVASAFGRDKARTYLRHAGGRRKDDDGSAVTDKYIAPQFRDLKTVCDEDLLAWGVRHKVVKLDLQEAAK